MIDLKEILRTSFVSKYGDDILMSIDQLIIDESARGEFYIYVPNAFIKKLKNESNEGDEGIYRLIAYYRSLNFFADIDSDDDVLISWDFNNLSQV